MSDYLFTLITRENGTEHLAISDERQYNVDPFEEMKKDATEFFRTDDMMTDRDIERAVNSLATIIEDVDGEIEVRGTVRGTVRDKLHAELDPNVIDICDIDLDDFLTVKMDVDKTALAKSIKDSGIDYKLDYKLVLDAFGIKVYTVYDPNNMVVGKVILTRLGE